MVSEESVAHFGYLSRYTILPASAKEGPLGSGRSQPLCNQCSPDLIPRRTHPTRIRGPGRDTSRPQRRPGPGRTVDAGAERIPQAGGSPAEPARGWEECKVPFLAGNVRAGVRGGTGVKKQREEQRQGIRDVTPSKKRSDKGVKDRETECHKQKQRHRNTEPNKRQKKTKRNRGREAGTQREIDRDRDEVRGQTSETRSSPTVPSVLLGPCPSPTSLQVHCWAVLWAHLA